MKRSDGIAFLTTDPDTGEDIGHLTAPCSPYGPTAADCAPVAWRVAFLVARETGEPLDTERLAHAMDMVVNGHDDVAYVVRTYGHGHYT